MGSKPGYKRSWKNLLLNKRYQLRFTLFMVGVSAVLMSGLGIWVMKEANEATTVAMARVRGEACPKVPEVIDLAGLVEETSVPMNIEEPPPPEPTPEPEAAPSPDVAPQAAPDPAADEAEEEAAPARRPQPSRVDPAHVADHHGNRDLLAVKALWCTDAECKPETATPLQIKVKNCDEYVKSKLANADAVDALRKASIPVVNCDGGGEPYSVAEAEPERRATVQLEESSMTITPT